MLSIAVANKCEVAHMAFRSACINLIFTFSKGQRHDNAHSNCEYRANRGRWGKHYQTLLLPTNRKSLQDRLIRVFTFNLGPF